MESVKFKVTWKTIIFPLLGLIGFLAYLYVFSVDIPKVIETVQVIDLKIYLWGIVFVILEIFFFALSWRSLLRFLSVKLSTVKSFLYVWYSIFVDLIIPAESVSGEITRVYLVTRDQNGASGKAVASVVAHRLMGMGINIGSLLIGIGILFTEGRVSGFMLSLTLILAFSTALFLGLLILLCFKETWTLRIIEALLGFAERITRGRWKLGRIRQEVIDTAKAFHGSMQEFARAPKTLTASLAFYILSWAFSLSVTYVVFRSLQFQTPWGVIIVTSAIIVAVRSIPIGVPFEFGLPEMAMTTLYGFLGVPFNIAGAFALLNTVPTVWFRLVVGVAVQQCVEYEAMRVSNGAMKIEKA